jgi:FixJ family two-component response regulator
VGFAGQGPNPVANAGQARGFRSLPKASVISIIDDDEPVRSATASLVRSHGYEARMFPSAEAFLQSLPSNPTDCLITDVQMPGMDGLQLQAMLIAQGCTVPMIFITAFLEEHIRRRALAAGAVCILGKPFSGDALIEGVRLALQ